MLKQKGWKRETRSKELPRLPREPLISRRQWPSRQKRREAPRASFWASAASAACSQSRAAVSLTLGVPALPPIGKTGVGVGEPWQGRSHFREQIIRRLPETKFNCSSVCVGCTSVARREGQACLLLSIWTHTHTHTRLRVAGKERRRSCLGTGGRRYESSSFRFILTSTRSGWGGKGKMRFNADIAIKPWFSIW